jgi:HEAT repeat protein
VIASLACGDDRIFVLSDLGRFSPSTRESFWEPETQLELAQVLATHLVPLTSRFVDPANVSVDYGPFAPSLMSRDAGSSVDTGVEIVRRDTYFRTADRECITLDLNRFPTQGRYLVLVAGGGTAGASAGISSARAGATTLIAEYLHGLGGVGTEGRIGSYYHGNRVGFTSEVDRGTHAIGPDPWFRIEDGEWNTEWKKQWYLRASYEAGAEVWFGSLSVAAAVRGDRVTGAVIAGPYGVGLVRADATVDSTGNADVAAAAGAETVNISKAHVAVQGTGVSPFTPGKNSENTDHTFVDDTDVYDITRAFVIAREKFQDHFDLAQLIDSRQRQQVVGELSLDPLDFLAGRTFPDTITTAQSNFDSHGFTIHPLFMAKAPDKADIRAHVPFRCLIPKGLEGILITGLGVSAHRDALPVIRMQADVQNQGYAAGRAAATAAQTGSAIRDVDVKALQNHLVDIEVLEPDVPDHTDSFPLPEAEIQAAVSQGARSYFQLALIFGHPEKSVPYLREAYRSADSTEDKTHFARILGLLGDDEGIDTLIQVLSSRDWDEGWQFTGMGQFGFSLSDVDTLLIAAGRTKNPKAIPAMVEKLRSLSAGAEFSHMRAITLAFEEQPTEEAAPHFARLLRDERLRDASRESAAEAISEVSNDKNDTAERNRQLTELLLARGLYACGDFEGLARSVLEAYSRDFHGHYARHARAILSS